MPKVTGLARVGLIVDAFGSLAVAVLLSAAHFGIWMEGDYLLATPRINALTIGLGFVPVPAASWITYLWTRTRPSRFLDIFIRIVVSCVLLIGAGYSLFAAMFLALFVG